MTTTRRAGIAPIVALRKAVFDANIALYERGLAHFTFGNASGIDRKHGLVVIKPSGVPYDELTAADLVVTNIDGKLIAGKLKPSSDLATHLVLYRAFTDIGGIAHTHSRYATAWAQAWREIPCLGTTHADYFDGSVPITRALDRSEIVSNYEENTGKAIIRRFEGLDPMKRPGVLVGAHAPFTWGKNVADAVENAAIVEEVATLAHHTVTINPNTQPIPDALREKHFNRKHGSAAYYGQVKPL